MESSAKTLVTLQAHFSTSKTKNPNSLLYRYKYNLIYRRMTHGVSVQVNSFGAFRKKMVRDVLKRQNFGRNMLLEGFEPTQNVWKWHPPATKPLIALIIYITNFFYIILLFKN